MDQCVFEVKEKPQSQIHWLLERLQRDFHSASTIKYFAQVVTDPLCLPRQVPTHTMHIP